MAHATTVSIQKLCVGQLFCVGATLVAAHLRATTRVAPTAAPALSGYEWSQVGVFLLPPLMHRFTVDTVVGCAPRTRKPGQRNGAQAHPTHYTLSLGFRSAPSRLQATR